VKTRCGNGTLQKVSRGVLATARPATIWEARQFGLYCGVNEEISCPAPTILKNDVDPIVWAQNRPSLDGGAG